VVDTQQDVFTSVVCDVLRVVSSTTFLSSALTNNSESVSAAQKMANARIVNDAFADSGMKYFWGPTYAFTSHYK
jgi:hypothetical protein